MKPPQGVPYKSVESLSITLLERKTIKVILRDLNSVWLYPTAFQTRGDKMELSFGTKNISVYKQYKAKMSWTHHVEGDPLFQCRKYEANFKVINDYPSSKYIVEKLEEGTNCSVKKTVVTCEFFSFEL